MPESYLHKMAKELLYSEIEEKSGFEYKLENGDVGFESLIERDDYRGECVLMEFPTTEGYYPDEFGCNYVLEDNTCRTCHIYNTEHCVYNFDYDMCNGKLWVGDNSVSTCKIPTVGGFRFKTKNNTCKCSECDRFDFKGTIVHDIAAFWKGNVRWAIEIINKHTPDWNTVYASMPYKIFFVNAEDVLKRVDKTPVYANKIVYTRGIK